jgi:hypothetical protein
VVPISLQLSPRLRFGRRRFVDARGSGTVIRILFLRVTVYD